MEGPKLVWWGSLCCHLPSCTQCLDAHPTCSHCCITSLFKSLCKRIAPPLLTLRSEYTFFSNSLLSLLLGRSLAFFFNDLPNNLSYLNLDSFSLLDPDTYYFIMKLFDLLLNTIKTKTVSITNCVLKQLISNSCSS